METITEEELIGIFVGSAVGATLLGIGIAWFTCRRDLAVFCGCKLRSAPKVTPRTTRRLPSDDICISYNPILVLQYTKTAARVEKQRHPMKVTRIRKEFTSK